MLRKVSIVAGRGSWFGSGHWARMEVLSGLLRERQLTVEMLPAENENEAAAVFSNFDHGPESARIMDARDADPTGGNRVGGVLIDNRTAARSALSDTFHFFDSIPHPQSPLASVLENALIDPRLQQMERMDLRERTTLSAYMPPQVNASRVDELLLAVQEAYSCTRIVRVGGGSRPVEGVTFFERMERGDFLRLLTESRIVVSYFGMTMLEGWHAGGLPVLISIGSAVHDRLSMDLSNRTSIPFLTGQRVDRWVSGIREASGWFEKSGGVRSRTGDTIRPGNFGYARLIAALEEQAGSTLQRGRVH